MDREKLLLYKDEIEQLTYLFKSSEYFKQVKMKLRNLGVSTNDIFLVAKIIQETEEYGVIITNGKRVFTYFLFNGSYKNITITEIKNKEESLQIYPQLEEAFYIISRI